MKYKVRIHVATMDQPDGMRQTMALVMFLMRMGITREGYMVSELARFVEKHK